jgi:Nod factor-specific ABC transporter NodJ protein
MIMSRFLAVLWRDWLVFRSKFASVTAGAVAGPFLYLFAFGWGLGAAVRFEGMAYISFVVPGIVAMNSMTSSFSYIATDINLSRIYAKTFEAVMIAPVDMFTFAAAKISAGALRGLYGAVLILALSYVFQRDLRPDAYFFLALALNCCVFSAVGFIAGLLIDSHAGVAKASNFVITPMSFLCGTVFPLDKFPPLLKAAVEVLPLSQTANALRTSVTGAPDRPWTPIVVLCLYLAVLFPLAAVLCKRAE